MATYIPAKRATEYIFYLGLVSQSTGQFQASATLAAGDVKVSKDGGALANLTTLPAVTPAGSKIVKVTVSSTEMTADNVALVFSDAAGAEWDEVIVNIQTAANQIDDLSARLPAALSGDGFMKSDLKSIEDELTSGFNATLKLRQLDINNVSGTAVLITGGGVAGSGIEIRGDGSYGMRVIGGTNQPGMSIEAQSGSGNDAIDISGENYGIYIEGTTNSISVPNNIAVSDGNLTLAAIRDAVWAKTIETGYTALQSMRLMLSALAGKLSGAATTTVTIRSATDAKNRIVATVDESGNRTAVTHDTSD